MRTLPSSVLHPTAHNLQYGGVDAAVTRALVDLQNDMTPEQEFVAALEQSVTPIYIIMGLRGLRLDEAAAQAAVRSAQEQLDAITAEAAGLVQTELGWEEFNLLSPPQLAAALYGPREPEVCTTCGGTGRVVTQPAAVIERISEKTGKVLKPKVLKERSKACPERHTLPGCGVAPYHDDKSGNVTVQEEKLQKLIERETKQHDALKRPSVRKTRKALAIRLAELRLDAAALAKEVEFYIAPRMLNGRYGFEIKIGTDTLRTSSTSNAYGEGCLPFDAEVLTPNGWKQIGECSKVETIAQWEDGALTFLPATQYNAVTTQLVTWPSGRCVTPGHTMPWYSKRGKFKTTAAADIVERCGAMLPVSGTLVGKDTIPYPRLWVAAMADGSREGDRWRFSFKKRRKIDRFKVLCAAYGVKWWTNKAKDGYERLCIHAPTDWPPEFGSWMLHLTDACASAMLDEFGYWDGHKRGHSYLFYTNRKQRAEWVATLAHLHSYKASMREATQSASSWSNTKMYVVNISPRVVETLHAGNLCDVPPTEVFCFHTFTGYFLVRQAGSIWVSGNSNVQNWPRPAKGRPGPRGVVIADPGYKLWSYDLAGAESLVMAYLALDHDDIQAHKVYNPHCAVARAAWPEHPWSGETEHDKKLAKSIVLPHGWDLYDTAKRLRHGSQRYQSAAGAARTMRTSIATAAELLDAVLYRGLPRTAEFMRRFADGLSYWSNVHVGASDQFGDVVYAEKLPEGGGPRVTVHLGKYAFSRVFHTPPRDAGTARDAISFVLQAVVRINLWIGLMRVWRHLDHGQPATGVGPLEVLVDVHDSLLGQVRAGDEAVLRDVERLMLVDIPLNGMVCTIPVEGGMGERWSEV